MNITQNTCEIIELFEDGFFEAQARRIFSILKQKSSIKHIEIYATASKSTNVNFEAGFVKDAHQKTTAGIGLRIIDSEGREGMTYTSDFSDYALQLIVNYAEKMMKAATPNPYFKDLAYPSKSYHFVEDIYDPNLEFICPEDINDILQPIFNLKERDLVPKALSGGFSSSVGGTFIWNNNGISIWEKYSTANVSAEVSLIRANMTSSGFQWQSFCNLKEIDTNKVAEESYLMALRGLKKTTVETKEYPVVLSPLATAYFLIDPLTTCINAERVQNQMSFLGEYLHQDCFSHNLSIRDDPHIPGKLGTESFDAEGVPTKPLLIVEKGVLNTFYHNTFTAGKENIESNGHASRSGYNSPVGISSNNILVDPGKQAKDDIIAEIKEGIYLEYSGDTPNYITGDFSGLIMTGYLIKDGVLGSSLSETMLGVNLLDAFRNIEELSREREWIDEALVPWTKLRNIKISSR
ncbi:MAG: TldD/PmbA family protein [Candidatus Lokiarchaeota archaeon]|nr:TldD/PmbA family protein [Candidatus Harpocratesius repetitus]